MESRLNQMLNYKNRIFVKFCGSNRMNDEIKRHFTSHTDKKLFLCMLFLVTISMTSVTSNLFIHEADANLRKTACKIAGGFICYSVCIPAGAVCGPGEPACTAGCGIVCTNVLNNACDEDNQLKPNSQQPQVDNKSPRDSSPGGGSGGPQGTITVQEGPVGPGGQVSWQDSNGNPAGSGGTGSNTGLCQQETGGCSIVK